MELLLVVVGAIIVTALAHRKGLQPALIIVVVGLIVSFVPGLPRVELESEILLSVVLPPLLYSAALTFSFASFLRNIRPILGLGVGLVLVTAAAVGLVASAIVPALTFTSALLLGAIVAPPDAVTAVAIGRKLGLPKRVMAILTGESLVNDAAALTLVAVTVASIAGSHAFIENPVALFGYSAVVGPLVGLILGAITIWIRSHLGNPGLETVQGLVVPFAAFIVAEQLHASGVLAVVIAGFVVGGSRVRTGFQTRLQERHVWDSVDVLLEAFVFAYIGLQLRWVIQDLREAEESLVQVFAAAFVVLVVVLLVRPAWVFLVFGRGLLNQRVKNSMTVDALPSPRASKPRKTKENSRIDRTMLTWQQNLVVSWTGMRGVVTLAAAYGIPMTIADGGPFPERSTIQAIAFVVAVGTLLIQGATLPLLIRRLELDTEEEERYAWIETDKAETVVHAAADRVLEAFIVNPPDGLDEATLVRIRDTVSRQSQDADEMPDPDGKSRRAAVFAELYRSVIEEQRSDLIRERDEGRIDDEAARAMLERLDLQEAAVASRPESRL